MKRVTGIRDLSDDHQGALVLARRCKRGKIKEKPISKDALWDYVRKEFSDKINQHFHLEEAYLIPMLVTLDLSNEVSRIKEEHEYLRTLVNLSNPDMDMIRTFGEILESHVRFEEREVFEKYQQKFPDDILKDISESWIHFHQNK
jgi:hemerythrin-like domain-containing protein